MSTSLLIISIIIIAGATFLTRSLPFLIFPASRETPAFVKYLGMVLPCATIALLIVYCLRYIEPLSWPHGLPEIISLAATALMQVWKRNLLLSIAVGLGLYMVLIRTLFVVLN